MREERPPQSRSPLRRAPSGLRTLILRTDVAAGGVMIESATAETEDDVLIGSAGHGAGADYEVIRIQHAVGRLQVGKPIDTQIEAVGTAGESAGQIDVVGAIQGAVEDKSVAPASPGKMSLPRRPASESSPLPALMHQ